MIAIKYKVIKNIGDIERYSYSKLSSFDTCRRMFKLSYLDGIKGWGNGFAQLGNLVHSIMERFYSKKLEQFELSDTFLNEFDEYVPYGVKLRLKGGYTKDLTDAYKRQCVDFLDKFKGFEGLKVVAIEENFNIIIEIDGKEMLLNGFIDLILVDNEGNYYVLDWKSKSKFKSKKEAYEYAKQLYIYAIYIEHKYGAFPKELRFMQFRIDHTEIIEFSEEVLNQVIAWISKTINDIDDEMFFCPIDFDDENKTFFCNNLCDFGQESGLCSFYSEYLKDVRAGFR